MSIGPSEAEVDAAMVPSRSPFPIAIMSSGTIRKKRSCNTSSMTRSQTYPRASGSLVGFNNGNSRTEMPTTATPETTAKSPPRVRVLASAATPVK